MSLYVDVDLCLCSQAKQTNSQKNQRRIAGGKENHPEGGPIDGRWMLLVVFED